MVCRHWKTKGWCRMESNCKFLHPEHKRGIAAPKGCSLDSANDGGMSEAVCRGMSTTSGLPGDVPSAAAMSCRRKRGGRNRSNKGNQVERHSLDREVAVTVLPDHMAEYSFSFFQGTQFV